MRSHCDSRFVSVASHERPLLFHGVFIGPWRPPFLLLTRPAKFGFFPKAARHLRLVQIKSPIACYLVKGAFVGCGALQTTITFIVFFVLLRVRTSTRRITLSRKSSLVVETIFRGVLRSTTDAVFQVGMLGEVTEAYEIVASPSFSCLRPANRNHWTDTSRGSNHESKPTWSDVV